MRFGTVDILAKYGKKCISWLMLAGKEAKCRRKKKDLQTWKCCPSLPWSLVVFTETERTSGRGPVSKHAAQWIFANGDCATNERSCHPMPGWRLLSDLLRFRGYRASLWVTMAGVNRSLLCARHCWALTGLPSFPRHSDFEERGTTVYSCRLKKQGKGFTRATLCKLVLCIGHSAKPCMVTLSFRCLPIPESCLLLQMNRLRVGRLICPKNLCSSPINLEVGVSPQRKSYRWADGEKEGRQSTTSCSIASFSEAAPKRRNLPDS